MNIEKLDGSALNTFTFRIMVTIPRFTRSLRIHSKSVVKWLSLGLFLTAMATLIHVVDNGQKTSLKNEEQKTFLKTIIDNIEGLSILAGVYLYGYSSSERHKQKRIDAWIKLSENANKFSALEYLNGERESLQGLILKDVQLNNINLVGADLRNADLSGSILKNAKLSYSDLSNADLQKVDLRDADLSGAKLSGAKLDHAKLERANLSNADLVNATLTNVIARKVNLQKADLRNSDLNNADLRHSNLQKADLNGANLADAKYTSVDWTGAIMPEGSLWVEGTNISDYLLED